MFNEFYTKLEERYSIRKSIDKVNSLVGAPLDGWMQDPDIELAESKYIPSLVELFGNEELDDDDNFYVVELLLACFEVAVEEKLDIDSYWNETICFIEKDIDLHASTLAAWSCYDSEDPNDPEYMFPITLMVRTLWDKYQHNYL